MSKDYQNIRSRIDDAVLTVTIDRPRQRNALSRDTLREIDDAFTRHTDSDTLKVAVLTGSGGQAFAAGGDLKEFSRITDRAQTEALFDIADRTLTAVRQFPLPTVALIDGVALGGGAELAMACDFRLATANSRIGYVHAALAITPGFGGGSDLIRRLGPDRALLHMLRAEPLPASEAQQWGLIDEVGEPGQTPEALRDRFIEPILQRPVQVIRTLKALTRSKQAEREGFIDCWLHDDHWAALTDRQRR